VKKAIKAAVGLPPPLMRIPAEENNEVSKSFKIGQEKVAETSK